jgi:hypothetical protein
MAHQNDNISEDLHRHGGKYICDRRICRSFEWKAALEAADRSMPPEDRTVDEVKA